MIVPYGIGFRGDCWYCKKNMDNEEHIQWQGKTIIELHIKCARALKNKLIDDLEIVSARCEICATSISREHIKKLGSLHLCRNCILTRIHHKQKEKYIKMLEGETNET